nr:CsbD family protein [uncultured Brevundimonas sp.]
MTDEQINGGAAQVQGKAQKAFGKLVGDQKLEVEGAYNDAKGKSLEQFGKAMDAVDRLVEKAPENYRPKAREVAAAAREKPLLTTLSVAGVGLLLAGLVSRGLRRN